MTGIAILANMKRIPALEAKTRFGEVLDAAQRQPVSITRNGRPSVVILSAESYARRQKMAAERMREAMQRAGWSMRSWRAGIEVLMTEATFGELVSRLEKPKFDPYRDAEQWHAFLAALVDRAQWVDDSGEADAIISGNRALLGLGVYEGVPILTPAEFLARVRR